MARIHGRSESKGWTHSEAISVIKQARDVRLREAAGTYGTSSDEPADGSLRRLMALDKALGDWERVREWRRSQLAMLFPGKMFPEPKRIDWSAIIR